MVPYTLSNACVPRSFEDRNGRRAWSSIMTCFATEAWICLAEWDSGGVWGGGGGGGRTGVEDEIVTALNGSCRVFGGEHWKGGRGTTLRGADGERLSRASLQPRGQGKTHS